MKRKISLVALVFLAACSIIPRRVDLSGRASVAPFIGAVVRAEKELVVFQYRGSGVKFLGEAGVNEVPALNEGMTFPFKTPDVIALGRVAVGTELKISKVSRKDTFEMNLIDIDSVVVGPLGSPWMGERLNLAPLTIDSSELEEMPEFRSGFLKR
ncbi:MAG: hypothetical protein IPP68_00745 [Elusimicrobia bacterium]|nr:hypothetical protein [Elusimicrobiota bacterium]